MAVRTATDARWDCHGCGDCCRFYELGPVEPAIVQGLIDRDVASAWAPARDAWFTMRRSPSGQEGAFLTHRDGHCVFLREDAKCAIHALYGAAAKPGFCREYPFHLVDDPLGTAVVVRASCSSVHHGVAGGTPVADQATTVASLPNVFGRRRFAPEIVPVLADVGVPLDAWMDHEARLLTMLDDVTDVEVGIARLRVVLFTIAERDLPESDPRRARLAVGAVIEALRRLMAKAADDPSPTADAHRVAFAVEARDMLTRSQLGLASPSPLADEAQAYLMGLLRSFVLAKGWSAIGSVAEGLGLFAVQVAMVRADIDRDAIDAASASGIIVRWTRMIENPAITGVLRMARPALADVVRFGG